MKLMTEIKEEIVTPHGHGQEDSNAKNPVITNITYRFKEIVIKIPRSNVDINKPFLKVDRQKIEE